MELKRFPSIDAFRGFAVLLMLFFNFLNLLARPNLIPFFFKHNQGQILLFGDLIAPFFQFLVGVALAISVIRRESKGQRKEEITKVILRRFLLVILIGYILDVVHKQTFLTWGVLETLGLGGIIAYATLRFSDKIKILISALFLGIFTVLSFEVPAFLNFLRLLPHGSPLAILSWAPITIIGTIFGKEYIKSTCPERPLVYAGVIGLIGGEFLSDVIPANKLIVSPSYTIISIGACVAAMLLFKQINETWKIRFRFLEDLGKNALLLWIMQFIFVYYPMEYLFRTSRFLSLEMAVGVSGIILIVFWTATRTLNKKGYYFKI